MIVQIASKLYLEKGFSETSNKEICEILNISPGNLTFHYPQREHVLTEFVKELCDFQRRMIDVLEHEDKSPLLALCMEFATMAAAAEDNAAIRDIYIAAYTHPMPLAVIRENDTRKNQQIFADFNPDWTEEQFRVMEILYSGVEYAVFSSAGQESTSLDMRVACGLNAALRLYNVPESLRNQKIEKIIAMDYRSLGKKILSDFRDYITAVNWHTVETTRRKLLEKSNKNSLKNKRG